VLDRRKVWLGLGASAAIGLAVGFWPDPVPQDMHFLSVGQGDATLIRADGLAILVDCGPKSEGFDAGVRLIAPKLRRLGVDRIDILILTHPDMDHIGGLAGLSKRVPIGSVVLAEHFKDHAEWRAILQTLPRPPSQIRYIDQETIQLPSGKLELVSPKWLPEEPDNEGSLFLHLKLGNGTAMLTGDASIETEILMAPLADWSAQILKAGHHGSATSTSREWLEEVRPKWTVLSCGSGNSYGHPHASTLWRIHQANAQPLRTDRLDDIRFVLTPDGFKLSP
jgi:competence protein ComEC